MSNVGESNEGGDIVKRTITFGLRPFVVLSTLTTLGFGGVAASALELGAGRLKSAPGAPLDVEIPLLQVGEGELDSLKPQLPANSRSAELANATVELAQGSDGAAVLRVRSSGPLSADSVRFVVVADWGRGRRFREYTFSLTAEGSTSQTASGSSVAPAPASSSASAAPAAEPPPAEVTTLSTASPGSPDEANSSGEANVLSTAGNDAGLSISTDRQPETRATESSATTSRRIVRPGETLMSISREWSAKTGATLAQTMVGIYRANPQAFGPGGMSELLVNAELSLPDSAALGGTSAAAASGEISRELGIWRTGGAAAARDNEGAGMRTLSTAPAAGVTRLPETLPPMGTSRPSAAKAATPVPAAAPRAVSPPAVSPPAAAARPAAPLALTPAPAAAAPETAEAKAARLELELTEKVAALDAASTELDTLRARIAALEAAASAVKEKQPVGWLAKAREWAAFAWWAIPALLFTVLVLLLALVLKGRRRSAEALEASAASRASSGAGAVADTAATPGSVDDVDAASAPREMTFELPPIKPNRAEPVVAQATVVPAPAPAPTPAPTPVRAPVMEEPSMVSDLEGDPPPVDEAGSKIDLARAFIEMGHHDAAILELQAALRIGDERQRAEAIRLLDSLPKS